MPSFDEPTLIFRDDGRKDFFNLLAIIFVINLYHVLKREIG